MRFGIALLLSVCIAACSDSLPGACKDDTTCKPGSRCDPSRSLCVVPNGECLPACATGQICVNAACRSSDCNPVCPATEECDHSTATCKPVGVATVAITSPAANSYTGLQ